MMRGHAPSYGRSGGEASRSQAPKPIDPCLRLWQRRRLAGEEAEMCRWLVYSGSPVPPGGVSLPARAFADRPEPQRQARHAYHQWRRLRRRLVRRGRGAGALQGDQSGLERPESARVVPPHQLGHDLRPHPGLDRHAGPAHQLPPLPARQVALDAQRPDRRFHQGQARARACRRSEPLSLHPRIERHRGLLLPRPDLRARAGCARRRGAGGRRSSSRSAAATASRIRCG